MLLVLCPVVRQRRHLVVAAVAVVAEAPGQRALQGAQTACDPNAKPSPAGAGVAVVGVAWG